MRNAKSLESEGIDFLFCKPINLFGLCIQLLKSRSRALSLADVCRAFWFMQEALPKGD